MNQQSPWPPKELPFDQPQWEQHIPPRSTPGRAPVGDAPTPQPLSWRVPQPGQFQSQPYPPHSKPQGKQGEWYKRHTRGVLIGLLCSLLVVLLVFAYNVTSELGSTKVATPRPSPPPSDSGQIVLASPTLAPTPTPTHPSKPTPTPTAVSTRALTPTPKPGPSTTEVTVTNAGFSPDPLTITVGSTVIWNNTASIPHTVTSEDGTFDSGNMPPDSSFRFTFAKPGTYHYVCKYHPNMVGMIIVK